MTDKKFFQFSVCFLVPFFKNDITVTFCFMSKLNWTCCVQCKIVACSIRFMVKSNY